MQKSMFLVACLLLAAAAVHAENGGTPLPTGPIAVHDFAKILVSSSNDTIDVLANDIGTGLTVTAVTQGTNGTVAIAGDSKSILYTPNLNYLGGDRFTYTITDANSATSTGVVEVGVVAPPPPPPTILAKRDEVEAHQGLAREIKVLANDIGDGITVTAVTQPTHGTVSIAGDGLSVTYTSTGDFIGEDHFTYTITDSHAVTSTGEVAVDVFPPLPSILAVPDFVRTHANIAAKTINVLKNDIGTGLTITAVTQGVHGAVAIAGDSLTITYTPAANFTGPDTFTYTITDAAAATSTGNVVVFVDNDREGPEAEADFASVPKNSPAVTIDVLHNDHGKNLTITAVTQSDKGGLVAIAADSLSVTYTPATGYAGVDHFTYTITDGNGLTSTGNVGLCVIAAKPVRVFAQASPSAGYVGDSIAFFVLVGDDGHKKSKDTNATLTFAWDFGDGTTSADRNPTHAYTTAGVYTATVTVSSGTSTVGSASVTVTIQDAAGPVARFTTGKVGIFVGAPVTFDGSSSVDPLNPIASYAWDFGDNSPAGDGAVVSHTYATAGEYHVTLTITDTASLTASVTRTIHVQVSFEAKSAKNFVRYAAKLNLSAVGQDGLSLDAVVNVGTEAIGAGTAVACSVAGQQFAGTLDAKLKDDSQTGEKWVVKSGRGKIQQGNVILHFEVRNTALAAAFTSAGVVPGTDPTAVINVTIPVTVSVGSTTVSLNIDSTAFFAKNGTKFVVTGGGE